MEYLECRVKINCLESARCTYLNISLEDLLHGDTFLVLDRSGGADLGTRFGCQGLAGVEDFHVLLDSWETEWVFQEFQIGVLVHKDKILGGFLDTDIVRAVEQVNSWGLHLMKEIERKLKG